MCWSSGLTFLQAECSDQESEPSVVAVARGQGLACVSSHSPGGLRSRSNATVIKAAPVLYAAATNSISKLSPGASRRRLIEI